MHVQVRPVISGRSAGLGAQPAASSKAAAGKAQKKDRDRLQTFLQSCVSDVAERITEERKSLCVGGNIRTDCQLSQKYRVSLFASQDTGGYGLFKLGITEIIQPPGQPSRSEPRRVADLPEDEEDTDLIKSIRTAVIVGEDGSTYQTKSTPKGMQLYRLGRDGRIGERMSPGVCDRVVVVVVVKGILGNLRYIAMQDYLATMTPERLPGPVKALLGNAPNASLLTEVNAAQHPLTATLNKYQKEVVDMARLRPARVVVGPPGTGKSHTIVALIAQMVVELPATDIVVLTSEKNGAVEAVAAHLYKASVFGSLQSHSTLFSRILQ